MFGSPNLGPLTQIPSEGPVNSSLENLLRWSWRIGTTALIGLLGFVAWLVWNGQLFTAGDDVGYNLGLIGGLMMLSLLLYPLRKRVKAFSRLGSMQAWFQYHQIAGIVGPTLVLFHSTFHVGAMNSRVALYAMILVALSGLVGRFIYRHIHKGMYGQHLTMRGAEEDLRVCAEDIRSIFAEYPEIQEKLTRFRVKAFAHLPGLSDRIWRFMTLRSRGKRLSRSVRNYIKKALARAKKENRLTRNQRILTYQLAKEKTELFIDSVCEASQLTGWERLFSLWHIAHVPFLYLLVVSGIVHVVAVHMY